MDSRKLMVLLVGAALVAGPAGVSLMAVQAPSLSGRWTINADLSQFPREVGFGMDVIVPGSGDRAGTESGDLPGSVRGNNPRPVSEEEALNTQQLIAEVRNPARRLTITQTDAAVTVAEGSRRPRVFHPTGREEYQPLDASPVATVTKWEGGRLVVSYKVEPDREIRFTYSTRSDPSQLVVQVQFVERGGRGVITRVYEAARPGDPDQPERVGPPAAAPSRPAWAAQAPAAPPGMVPAAPAATPPESRPAAGAAGLGQPPAGQAGPPRVYQPGQPLVPAVPAASDRQAAPMGAQRPYGELRGLTSLGVVVEGLGGAATSCGLSQDAIESAVTKSLTDSGLRVVTNSDEDTYLYVRVSTTAMTTGFCFSRYDATIYTNTMATPTYGASPVLVQVELMRNGGLAGGGARAHAESVMQSLRQYVDAFGARIRDANR